MAFAVVNDLLVKELLQNLIADNPTIRVDLFTNNLVPGRGDVLAAYTLAAYPGYAQVTWLPDPVTVDGSHRAQFLPLVCSFAPPSSGPDVDVYGFVLQYRSRILGGQHVGLAARFTGAPVTLTVGGAGVIFNLFARTFDAH